MQNPFLNMCGAKELHPHSPQAFPPETPWGAATLNLGALPPPPPTAGLGALGPEGGAGPDIQERSLLVLIIQCRWNKNDSYP